MTDSNSDNLTNISGVSFKDTETSVGEKLAKVYDLYAAEKTKEALSMAESDPNISSSAYGQVLIGNCYKQLGDRTIAMNHWRKAIQISPLENSAYVNIANDLYSSGKINEAIFNWQVACTIKPEDPVTNLNLAVAYNNKNSRIKSTKFYERYLRYAVNSSNADFLKIKQTITNLKAKAEFYGNKVEEFKQKKDLKSIAAIYLKMIATYANLPGVYKNIAEIFYFDKNYQKALEFYLLVYLNFPHTASILLEIGNLYYLLGHKSYAYVYYYRCMQSIPGGTSYYNKIKQKVNSLAASVKDNELIDGHLQKAKEAELDNNYEEAIDEYENYMILTDSDNSDIQQLIDKYKIFSNPEPFVINVLYSQIPDLMNKKKLNACVDLCDRIMTLSTQNTKEVVYAMRCKAECKRIIIAREQFGV